MKKWLALTGLLVVLFIAALLFIDQAPWATVAITFGERNYTTSFAVFVLAAIGVFMALRLFGALFGLPSRLIRAGRARRLEHLREEFEQGIALYLRGQWGRARKCFRRAAQDATLAHSANLLTVRCAAEDNDLDEARAALQEAREVNMKDDFCALLIQSEVLLKAGQPEQAAEHLGKLRRRRPDNRRIVDLLMQACEATGDWSVLMDAMPQVRKLYARQPDKLRAVEIPVARRLLQRAAGRMDVNMLERQWHAIDAAVKPALLAAYAEMLVSVGARETAERVLREAIESRWDEDCMVCYGSIEGGDIDGRLKHAERWLKSRPKDPALLLCLGKLYRQAELWDQARHYLKASFSLAPKPETFRELVFVFDYVSEGRFD